MRSSLVKLSLILLFLVSPALAQGWPQGKVGKFKEFDKVYYGVRIGDHAAAFSFQFSQPEFLLFRFSSWKKDGVEDNTLYLSLIHI